MYHFLWRISLPISPFFYKSLYNLHPLPRVVREREQQSVTIYITMFKMPPITFTSPISEDLAQVVIFTNRSSKNTIELNLHFAPNVHSTLFSTFLCRFSNNFITALRQMKSIRGNSILAYS